MSQHNLLKTLFCVTAFLCIRIASAESIEHDTYPAMCGQATLVDPDGMVEVLNAVGLLEEDVFFPGDEGSASDGDGNGLDEVPLELTELNLVGSSPSIGAFYISFAAAVPPTGEIEERANTTVGTLDLPPFQPAGTADQTISIVLEIGFGGDVYTAATARVLHAVISHKPASVDTPFASTGGGTVLLNGQSPSGYVVTDFHLGCGEVRPTGFVLACFYECKQKQDNPRVNPDWNEISTLMVANPTNLPLALDVAFYDGNENPLALSRIELSVHDLDELNVCRTLMAGGIIPPSAGLVELLVADPRNPGGSVDAWVKNLLGKFHPNEDEPFDGSVDAIAKTQCQSVPAGTVSIEQTLRYVISRRAPRIDPILVEGTEDSANR